MKILVKRENSYQHPGSPHYSPWGQYLYFADGSKEFDPHHQQSDAIGAATAEAARLRGLPNPHSYFFVSGWVGKTEDGKWVPVPPSEKAGA